MCSPFWRLSFQFSHLCCRALLFSESKKGSFYHCLQCFRHCGAVRSQPQSTSLLPHITFATSLLSPLTLQMLVWISPKMPVCNPRWMLFRSYEHIHISFQMGIFWLWAYLLSIMVLTHVRFLGYIPRTCSDIHIEFRNGKECGELYYSSPHS